MTSIYGVIIGGVLAIVAGLVSQTIAAITALRTKRLELFYGRKADAYRALYEKAADFQGDPKSNPNYLAFQSALHSALIVASEEVADILDNPRRNGLHVSAGRLFRASSEAEIQHIQMQTAKPLAKGAGRDGITELCAAGGCMPPEHAITALPGVSGLISLSCGAHLSAAAWTCFGGGAWG